MANEAFKGYLIASIHLMNECTVSPIGLPTVNLFIVPYEIVLYQSIKIDLVVQGTDPKDN